MIIENPKEIITFFAGLPLVLKTMMAMKTFDFVRKKPKDKAKGQWQIQ